MSFAGKQMSDITPDTVLNFWFTEIDPRKWWVKDEAFDELIRSQLSGACMRSAHAGELFCLAHGWHAKGRLAEIIVLDQFSRNMFRDTPRAFASDPLALILAQEAIACGADKALNEDERGFMILPYMHSESRVVHEAALVLYRSSKPDSLDFEMRHKAIIDRFGRFPHRNAILGRESSAEEIEFLKQPGSSF